MKGIFLRGLWGDVATPRLSKVRSDMRRAAAVQNQPTPVIGMAYGSENASIMREEASLDSVRVVHNDPLVDWFGYGDRGALAPVTHYPESQRKARRPNTSSVHHPYGVSIWRHKLEVLAAGLKEAEAVCWLDWDCRLLRELPTDWWGQMAKGAAFQAALSCYKKPKCHWRPGPWGDASRNVVPCGSFVYCRDATIINRLLEIQNEHQDWYDETVYAYWVDEACGGWPGIDEYHRLGFQPEGVYVHRPPVVPKDPLFYAPLSIWKVPTN